MRGFQRWHRSLRLSVLVMLLLTLFPQRPVIAQSPLQSDQQVEPSSPPTTLVAPFVPRENASLIVTLSATAPYVRVGETTMLTVTVSNQSSFAAYDVVVTLPVPIGATPITKRNLVADGTAWVWTSAEIVGRSEQTFAADVHVIDNPPGQAVLSTAQVTAKGLDLPVSAVGGAVIDNPLAAEIISFAPGKATTLHSGDAQVTVNIPIGLSKESLSLKYSVLAKKQQQKDFVAPKANPQRSFAPFFLDATNAQGTAVHHFDAPVTIAVHYTPEQLQALGIDEVDLTIMWYNEDTQQWEPQSTDVDSINHEARTSVNHFSGYTLSDGSAPSEAYIPSLEGWQVSTFMGAANFSYPIEVPAGPGGIKPQLNLSYNSTSSDGKTGLRAKQQAGWVGRDWNLDTGSIAFNKMIIYSNEFTYYSIVMNGQSFDLIRGEAALGNTGQYDKDPSHWLWNSTDENYNKVGVIANGLSDANRGARTQRGWLPRYTWRIWTKDGTKFDFSDDAWWGWNRCDPELEVYFETYKWQLSKVTDVHGNTITYQYGRDSYTGSQENCQFERYGQGKVDRNMWPTSITWGANTTTGAQDRYQVEFASSQRANDTAFDGDVYNSADVQYAKVNGHVRQTQQLDAIRVWSKPNATWELVRQYNLRYGYTLLSDLSVGTGSNPLTKRLTLNDITRVGNDGVTALPMMTFTYGDVRGTDPSYVKGDWNRLTRVNNGQGGILTFGYENIGSILGNTRFANNRRVISKKHDDGRGSNYNSWRYSYTNPAYNTIGTVLGETQATNQFVNSATLYYAKYVTFGHDYSSGLEAWTAHPQFSQFLGHSKVVETDPNNNETEHYFYQGDVGCNPTARSSHVSIDADPCFRQLRDREILRGKEYRTVTRGVAGSAILRETQHKYTVEFSNDYGYSYLPVLGLWRAFSYESETSESVYEGGSTPLTKRTTYSYSPTLTGGAGQIGNLPYGNMTVMDEYDATNTLYRRTKYQYETTNTTTSYIVDRRRSETVLDGLGQVLTQATYQYDGNTTTYGTGSRGLLTLVRKFYDIPLSTNLTNILLHGVETSFGYDAYGNQTSVTTYADAGTKLYNGSTTIFSAPGNGSAATTTTTTYDSVFHAFSVQIDPPTVNSVTLTERAGYHYRMGTLTSITDPNGNITNAEYDSFGRMVKLIKPGDTSAMPTIFAQYYDSEVPFRYTYNIREESGQGGVHAISQYYDGMGRKIQTKTESEQFAQNSITDSIYDGVSNILKESQPRFVNQTNAAFWSYTPVPSSGVNWTTKTYDAIGRMLTMTTPDGTQTRQVYEVGANMMLSNTIDPKRHRVQQRTDVFGRLVQVLELKGTCGNYWGYTCATGEPVWTVDATTKYDYSPLDLLTKVTDANNNITTMTYDSLGRKRTMSDPDMGAWSYQYDVDGNLLTQRDAKNQTITFAYDALSRLTSKKQGSTTLASYGYDQMMHPDVAGALGLLSSMVDNSGSHTYGYDGRGQLVYENQTINDGGLGYNYDTYRSYRADGQLATLQYPTGETLTYGYNAARQPTTVSTSLGGQYVTSTNYDPLGQKLTEGMGNGVTSTYGYDALSKRLSSLTAAKAGTTVFQRNYTYDLGGNVQTIAANDGTLGSEILRYSYDDRDRLTNACAVGTSASTTCLGGSTFNQTYAYDKIGNFTSKAGSTYTFPTNGVRPHAVSSVAGQAYTYDANGNLLTGGGRTYTWNVENQPTQIVANGTTEAYAYDGNNARVKKTTTTSTTSSVRYAFGGLVEYRSNGTVTSNYGVAVRTTTGIPSLNNRGALAYMHSDHLGSVGVTTDGVTGAVAEAERYDPWGKTRAGNLSSTEIGYTGQRKDAGTGLLFYNARYYDPALARFLQADSIVPNTSHRSLTVDFHELGFRASMAGENTQGFWFQLSGRQRQQATPPWGPGNPQELNRYSYVNNNPLKYTDPSGHIKLTREEAGEFGRQFNAMIRLITEAIRGAVNPADVASVLKNALIDFVGTQKGIVGYLLSRIANFAYDSLVTYSTIAEYTAVIDFLTLMSDGLFMALGSNSSYVFIEFSSLGGGCGGSDTNCEFAGGATLGFYWSTGSYIIDGSMVGQGLLDDFYQSNVDLIGDCRRSNQTSCADPNTPNPKPEKGVPSGPLNMNH